MQFLGKSSEQSSKCRCWISKQSQIRSRRTRFNHSMDTILSVQTKHFSGDRKEFTKVSRAVGKEESHLYRQLFGIWQILWRFIMESLYIDTRSETNGIAERSVRRVKEGTSTVLLQSDLDEKWWVDSLECCCYLRKVQDFLADGKHRLKGDLEEPFEGPVIPFGSMVDYHPVSAKNQSRLHQMGKTVSAGIFLGYALCAGGNWQETLWSQTMRSWKIWTRRKSMLEESMRGKWQRRVVKTSYSQSQRAQ